jgi:hypothetical protein
MGGDLVKLSISPNPHISPHFPAPSSYFDFGDEREKERIEIR